MTERPLPPLSPEEEARRRPSPPAELLGASWEPVATPERRLVKGRTVVRLPKRRAEGGT